MRDYTIAAWLVLTVACYFAGSLFAHWPLPLALLVSLLLATLAVQALPVSLGLILPNRDNLRFNSAVCLLVLVAAAVYFAQSETWLRFVAWQSLALIALILGTRAVILAFAVAAPVALVLLWPTSPLAGIGVVALSHALLLFPTLQPNVQWLGPVVTRFATDKRELWLTIDDGPADDTPALLDLLDRRNAKATFFVKGMLAEQRPELIGEIVARGHSVANHSQTHPSGTFWCLLPSRVRAEVEQCNRVLAPLTGKKPRWFRAPVGHKNASVHPTLAREEMRLIGWTARGFDAVMDDPRQILDRILPRVKPGAIVVLHQGRAHSLRVIEHVLDALQERGYALVIPDDAALRNTNR
ncbi:MAG TPA: polysaccharide deacetylase family protein [Thermoanaerobaculia bacterium]|nr:polysaccharide deacetylase family protein [Thermoanaerobaculia bacterium]